MKYQCLLPGIVGQVAGGEDELYLRFEFDQTQMRSEMPEGEALPTQNECWIHEMVLSVRKGPNARLNWEQAMADPNMPAGRGYGDGDVRSAAAAEWDRYYSDVVERRATAFEVLSALSTVRWA